MKGLSRTEYCRNEVELGPRQMRKSIIKSQCVKQGIDNKQKTMKKGLLIQPCKLSSPFKTTTLAVKNKNSTLEQYRGFSSP